MPSDAIHRHIAKQIRSLAQQQGWSGNRLADTAGVSRAQLSRLLTLQTSPTIGLLKKIAAALDVDMRELLPSGNSVGRNGKNKNGRPRGKPRNNRQRNNKPRNNKQR